MSAYRRQMIDSTRDLLPHFAGFNFKGNNYTGRMGDKATIIFKEKINTNKATAK